MSRPEYRIEPCRSALNPVRGMPFKWSLNPFMGCAHRCTFCYVRHFEQRADRPSDERYGRSIRVKPNVAEVLRRELARRSWQREEVALGTATDPYQPAEGRASSSWPRRGRRSRSSPAVRSSYETSTCCALPPRRCR
jgi:DNA repair photolyase